MTVDAELSLATDFASRIAIPYNTVLCKELM